MVRRTVIIMALCISSTMEILSGQAPPPDYNTVVDIFHNEKSPEIKCDTLLHYIYHLLMYNKLDEVRNLCNIGIQYSEKENLKLKTAYFLNHFGKLNAREKNYNTAIENCNKSLTIINDESDQYVGKNLLEIAVAYQNLGIVDSMSHYFHLAEQWFDLYNPYRKWIIYESISNFYNSISDLKETEALLTKAYKITKPAGIPMDHGLILYRLRQLASRLDDMDMMAKYDKEYYELVNGKTKVHILDLGENLSPQEKIYRYERLLEASQKISFTESKNNIYSYLVPLYIEINQPSKALKFLNLIDTSGSDDLFLQDYYTYYSTVHSKLKDYKKANEYLILEKKQREKIQQSQKQELVATLNAKYENEKKERQLSELKLSDATKSIQLNEAEQKKNRYGILSGLLIILVLISIYFYRINKNKNKLLEAQNKVINENLEEKEVLLREIHHRVKNNLQVISSLLSLQSSYIQDDEAAKAINEGKDRVSSMALIHQNLYSDKDVTSINTEEYLGELVEYLFDTYNIHDNEIELITNIQPLQIDIDTMVPIGLIANELISNALKHGYNSDHKGLLQVEMYETGQILYLTVKDNGKGMTPHEFFNSKSFGNKLIQSFKSKLGAEIEIINDGGTTITVAISKYKKAA